MRRPPSLRHPGRWIWLILLVPILVGLLRLRVDVEVFNLLPSDLPEVEGLRLYQERFADARELIVTLSGPDAETTESAAQALAQRLRAETNRVDSVTWTPPWLEHPDQAAELIGYLWLNQPPEVFAGLSQSLIPSRLPALLASARERLATSMSPQEIAQLSYDPFGLTHLPETVGGAVPSFGRGQELFSSSDGRFRIMFVKASADLRTYRDCAEWLQTIRSSVNAELNRPGQKEGVVLAGFTGRPAFVAEAATDMQRDVMISVGGTAVIIALLFWLAHRRLKPMLWLLTLLALILGSTLALGGLIFGAINVVSMGFAAILLGLAVDYAVVHYQEALAHPRLSVPQIRRAIAPSIFWAAVTTIAAFLMLNFGGLPGLGQLGTLVGVGVFLAALIMIFEFLPPLFPGRNEPSSDSGEPVAEPESAASTSPTRLHSAIAVSITGVLVLLTVGVLLFGMPHIDPTASALRPSNSPAYGALSQIQQALNRKRDPLWVIVSGETVTDVGRRLAQVQPILSRAQSNHVIADFTLPTPLWPQPAYQETNRQTALQLAAQRRTLTEAATNSGFSPTALVFTDRILDTWQLAGSSSGVFWPTNPMSRWIFERMSATSPTNFFALGLVNPIESPDPTSLDLLRHELGQKGLWLSGWELLGQAIFTRVKANLWKVLAPMVGLVLLSLFLAFRRASEILLSLTVLGLSGLALLAIMRLAGWSWNLLNLMAVPLILGTGVDYGIFMQLALRRFNGDLRMTYHSVGRALLLCGGTAVAGFGSLSFSSSAGMASLGQVCAVGIAYNMVIAIFLLPAWWHAFTRPSCRSTPRPSFFYGPAAWRLGLWTVRALPIRVCVALTRFGVGLYWIFARHRREVVIENLLPALNDDVRSAERTARKLYDQFALKLVDLWRYEAGLPIDDLLGVSGGWEHFEAARKTGRGVLIVTPHLGNWEFGSLWLSRRGVSLQVVTLAEPGQNFTELRRASRARWKIDTLVIGNDPFAFLEIIRRLEDGATVALLVDRPPEPTATTVQLFGRDFSASIAAAELARASGCAVLPVYIPRNGDRYDAWILPPVTYHRPALRDRAERQRLAQEIMARFEPIIHQHLEQWFHFVPLWKKEK